MTIDVILFDAGDILYNKPTRGPALEKFLAERGCAKPDRNDPQSKALRIEAHAGRLGEEEYYRQLLAHFGLRKPEDIADGIDLLRKVNREVEFFDGVSETLHELKRNGFHLGIVTNTFNSKAEKLEWFGRIGIDQLWDSYANSCDLQLVKPDPKIYLAALEPLGARPANAAFVGHAQKELDGAKALGMTTIRFNGDPDCVTADHCIESFSDLASVAATLRNGATPAERGGSRSQS